jgi:hypothetical protein
VREACDWPINKARRPGVRSNRAAANKAVSKRSTARRVTIGAEEAGKSWARPVNTSMCVNLRARITSRRKVAFLCLDSMRVTDNFEAQILMGSPGKPAPEPRSSKRAPSESPGARGGERERFCAAKMDSPKCRVTICSGSRTAVRFSFRFQRSSISMYVDIFVSCASERGLARKGPSSTEMQPESIDGSSIARQGSSALREWFVVASARFRCAVFKKVASSGDLEQSLCKLLRIQGWRGPV